MKGKIVSVLLLIFYVVVSIDGTALAQQNQETITRVAQLEDVIGDVFVKRGGGLKDFSAYDGMSLLEGDFIQTEADSSVTIVFEDNRTTLGAHTQVYVTKLKNEDGTKETVLSQWSGQTWHNVKNLLNANDTHDVESATSIMGVRGTLFTIIIDPASGIERLVVLEGIVENRLQREKRSGQPGQDVAVAEQMDIRLETKERIERIIDFDELVEEIDVHIIAVIYEDVLNRADEFFAENDGVDFEDRNKQMKRVLVALEADMMLDLIDQLTQAIKRTEGETQEQIEAQLFLKMQKDIKELEQEILEKRLRQIDQYEQLREQARENGITDEELEAFIEQIGGERMLERSLEVPEIKKELEERLQQPESPIENSVNADQSDNELPNNLANPTVELEPSDEGVSGRIPIVGDDPIVMLPLPPTKEEERPVEDPPPIVDEEDPVEDAPPPVDEEDPIEDAPPPVDEEDPIEDPPSVDEDDEPEVTSPEVKQLEPIQISFNHVSELKMIEHFLIEEDDENMYQFTGVSEYDSSIVTIRFDQLTRAFTIQGKTEGTTEVMVQIIDRNEQIEPIPVHFTVHVENLLPDSVVIPAEYRDQLLVTYEHRTEVESDDRLHISLRDGLSGHLNGWLINDISIWLGNEDESTMNEDHRVRFSGLVSCSAEAFRNQIPTELCIEMNDIPKFENDGLIITPLIDSFSVLTEPPGEEGLVIRDVDESGNPVVTAHAMGERQLMTWKVTYEQLGVIHTEDFREYMIAKEIGEATESIFTRLLECAEASEEEGGIPRTLCLTNTSGVKEITGVFSHNSDQAVVIENEQDVPVDYTFLAETSIIQLNFLVDPQLIDGLFELNPASQTTMIKHPTIPMQYYLFSDEAVRLTIDFVGLPIEIVLDGIEGTNSSVGTVHQQIAFYAWEDEHYLDGYWLMPEAAEGYQFKYWIITMHGEEMIDEWMEMNIVDYLYIESEVLFKAVFEPIIDGL